MVRIKILEDDPADRDTLIECLRKYEREQGQSFSITAYDNPSDFMDNYHMDADLIFMDIVSQTSSSVNCGYIASSSWTVCRPQALRRCHATIHIHFSCFFFVRVFAPKCANYQ